MTGKTAYEVNIWDTRPEQKYGTGAIVDVAKVDPMPHAGGKWNIYEITAKGNTFTVVLNGQKTVDGAQSDKFATAHRAPARQRRDRRKRRRQIPQSGDQAAVASDSTLPRPTALPSTAAASAGALSPVQAM